MPPPTLVGEFRGKCDICGLDVFSSQDRCLVKQKYVHAACYSGPANAGEQVVVKPVAVKPVAVKPVVKGPCIICSGEVTSDDWQHHVAAGYLHQT